MVKDRATALLLACVCAACGSSSGEQANPRGEPVAWAVALEDDQAGGGFSDVILQSTDGGRTWERAATFEGQRSLLAVQFFDRDVGWVVGGHAVLRTTDGGHRWDRRNLTDANLGILNLWFSNPRDGILVGARYEPGTPTVQGIRPAILRTRDGGETWQSADLSPGGIGIELRDACVATNGVGLAIGSGVYGGGMVLVSHDGGSTWSDVTARLPVVESVACAADDLWALGGGIGQTRVLRSADGGETWQDLSARLPIGAGIQAAAFLDANHGWLIGAPRDRGTVVLRTLDAGTTWVEQVLSSEIVTGMRAISFSSVARGVVVGSELSLDLAPLIFATADGGTSWTRGAIPHGVRVLLDVSTVP